MSRRESKINIQELPCSIFTLLYHVFVNNICLLDNLDGIKLFVFVSSTSKKYLPAKDKLNKHNMEKIINTYEDILSLGRNNKKRLQIIKS